jgi:peptide/nickel transport system permease protein
VWRRGGVRAVWRFLRHNPLALLGLVLCLLSLSLAALAPLIAPYEPLEQNIRDRMSPPGAAHPFGTDSFRRDILSRVLYGGRLSLPLAIAVVTGASVVGTLLGAYAGLRGGLVDEVLMRLAALDPRLRKGE